MPSDQLIRETALDPGRSFIVQAPAGSGKTELLIRRYLRLLSRVEEPEEIIAITFTRKAAAEMRTRVLEALDQAGEPSPCDDYRAGLREVADGARANNERRNWHLERHPSRLRIQTIDSLCASIATQMPWVSGIGALPEVVEDASPLYEAAAEETVWWMMRDHGPGGEAMSRLLLHLDVRVPRTIELLVDMLRFRDQWLRHIGRQEHDDPDWRKRVESVWRDQIRRDLRTVLRVVPESCRTELLECAAHAGRKLAERNPQSAIVNLRDAVGFPGAELVDLPAWRGLRELLLTREGTWRKRIDVNTGFPASPAHDAGMKKRMTEVLETLAGNDALLSELRRVGCLPDPSFDDQQWQILSALTAVLPMAAAQLQVLFADAGKVDFTEIGMRANQALGAPASPKDLTLRIDRLISHLLVDEFQDTSVSHFQIIESLTGGWQEGDGRTLFLVGDPMQSIYRFREAEVGLFLRVWERGMSNIDLMPLQLTENFRSDPEIVSWCNRVFDRCFPPVSDAAYGAVAYARSTPHLPAAPGAGVRLHALDETDPRGEGARTAELVNESWERNEGEGVAILVRTRSILRDILPALDEAGIRYSGVDISRLDWDAAVQDLLSLTRAFSYPADRVAWLAVLRAPWCGLTLHDLHVIAAASPGECIWDRVRDRKIVAGLSEDGRRRLERLLGPISEALENRSRLPLWRSLESLWLSIGGPACAGADSDGSVRAFLDLLREHGARWDEDLEGFMKILSRYWAQSEETGDGRLQIMTLHKAKGLEFDTVIIPGLGRQPRSRETRLLLWEEQMRPDDQSLLFAPSTEVGADRDPHYRYLSMLHGEKERFETLRLLYVGCTRARRSLHLVASFPPDPADSLKEPGPSTLLARLWPALRDGFEDAAKEHRGVRESRPAATRVLRRLASEWRLPALPPPVSVAEGPAGGESPDSIEYSWVGETARHVGVAVHAMLERIAREGIDAWDDARLQGNVEVWRRELAGLGVPTREAVAASGRMLEMMRMVIGDERARWLFDARHGDVRNEFAVSWDRPEGVRRMRIDRTFVDNGGTRWIVDYKSSMHEGSGLEQFLDSEQERYRQQLEDYARAIRAMAPGPIRLGLYFPMLAAWREWAFEE